MNEVFKFPVNPEFMMEKAVEISWDAVDEVRERYGDGYEDSRHVPTERHLPSHNMQHTLRVRDHTRLTTKALGLNRYDAMIAFMAASAHDVVHMKARGQMERESAECLAAHMRQAGFPEHDIEIAELAILGTEPLFDSEGTMYAQQASVQRYPTERARLIALSVACADLGDLCSPYGPVRSRELYQEMQGLSLTDTPSMNGIMAFQQVQLKLLANYQYPHDIGERQFGRLRPEVLEHQRYVTLAIQHGHITTWQQLLAEDQAFADRLI